MTTLKITIVIIYIVIISSSNLAEGTGNTENQWNILNINQQYTDLIWETSGYFNPSNYSTVTWETVDDQGQTGEGESYKYIYNEFVLELNSSMEFPNYQQFIGSDRILTNNINTYLNSEKVELQLTDFVIFIFPTIILFENGSTIDIFASEGNLKENQNQIAELLELTEFAYYGYGDVILKQADGDIELIRIADQGRNFIYLPSGILSKYELKDDENDIEIRFIGPFGEDYSIHPLTEVVGNQKNILIPLSTYILVHIRRHTNRR